jgi:hypothetical protein
MLYVSDLLSKYACYIDKSVTRRFDAPLDEGQLLSPDDSPVLGSPEYDAMTSRRNDYMAIVGGLLWLANMTRYDIAFVASQLARFLTNPGPPHFTAAILTNPFRVSNVLEALQNASGTPNGSVLPRSTPYLDLVQGPTSGCGCGQAAPREVAQDAADGAAEEGGDGGGERGEEAVGGGRVDREW